ncbi:hypothetical protein [Spongiactinospora rosea]|uniref:hypothetical protein n=1 Tax=Spongiactinospora rosea TaxID=2248750 RepID=UPI0013140C78|nr:hypothetical protein [Spongiactinospora rosea]
MAHGAPHSVFTSHEASIACDHDASLGGKDDFNVGRTKGDAVVERAPEVLGMTV